jgi:anti-anti-sigma factor
MNLYRSVWHCSDELIDYPPVKLHNPTMTTSRSPNISKQYGITIISLGSEYENLDEPGLEDLKEKVLDVARNADPPLVILDLSHTKFFGSAFIEVLFRTWNRLKGRDSGRFCISGLTPYCKEVIEVTHLDELWKIFDTLDEAIADLKSGD